MAGHIVYIGIGSNLNDPVDHVRQAIEQLAELPDSEWLRCSSLYASQPMGPQDQPDYINAVVSLHTQLTPLALLTELQGIETAHDRLRSGQRWGPRTLDLDILLYGQQIINLPQLVVPHPGLHERAFVLYPLHEIDPRLHIPGKGEVEALKQDCPADGLEKMNSNP